MKLQRGFTLIEVMIALMVFAVLSVIVSVGLRSVLNTYQRVKEKSTRFSQLEVALTVIQRDINQIVPRPILNKDGIREAAVVGKVLEVDLTRGGYLNPGAVAQRSSLLRVIYELKDGNLLRIVPSDLDETKTTTFPSRVLLPGVTKLSFAYVDEHNASRTFWPLLATNLLDLPRAIQMTITAKSLGTIHRTFMIPGGVPFAKPV